MGTQNLFYDNSYFIWKGCPYDFNFLKIYPFQEKNEDLVSNDLENTMPLTVWRDWNFISRL